MSSRLTVNGGAMRHTEPRSGRRRMFMLRPNRKHRSRGERAQFVMRLSRLAVLDQLDTSKKPHSPPGRDLFVALLQRLESPGQIVTHLAAPRQKVLLFDRLQNGEAPPSTATIGYVRRIEG